MTTKTLSKKVDITHNPFLAVTAEDCVRQFHKGNSTGNTCDYVIVPDYDFEIVSETKTSKKIIIFDDADNYGENSTKERIKEFLRWKQCYFWTGGALKLQIREEDTGYLDLVISKDRGYTMNPNIIRSAPFVRQILKHLETFRSASPDEGTCYVGVQTEGLDLSSFARLRGPIVVW